MLPVRLEQQTKNNCAPVALRIAASTFGVHLPLNQCMKHCTVGRNGTTFKQLATAAKCLGFSCKAHTLFSYDELQKIIVKQKKPVIVGWFFVDYAHYSVVVHVTKKKVWLADSYEKKIITMNKSTFLSLWFDITRQHDLRSKSQFIIRPALVLNSIDRYDKKTE